MLDLLVRNATLPDGLKLRHFVSLHKEFDPDDGEITRTRQPRRNVVESRYAPILDAVVARAMRKLAADSAHGFFIHESPALQKLGQA